MSSKVIRASQKATRIIKSYMDEENWSFTKALDKALDVYGHSQRGWALGSSLFRTKKEAKEASMREASAKGLEFEDIDQPIKVREI